MITQLDQVQALEDRSEIIHTPCGAGQMVWHAWGPTGGTPLLLLHGGSGSWTHWVRNIDALVAAGHRVLAADMPGCGDSAAPPEGEDADVIPPWLELGCQQMFGDRQVNVCGFSFGGLTTGLWAHQFRDRLRSMVLVGAPSLTKSAMPKLDLRHWVNTPEGPERDLIHRHNLRHLMLAHDESIDELAIRLHAANLVRDRMRGRRLSRTDVLRDKVPDFRCIVGGIYGAEDILWIGRHEGLERALSKAPKFHSLTLVPGAGHWAQYENAPAFNAALIDFLERTR